MNLPEGFVPQTEAELLAALPSAPLPSQWVLSRLNSTTEAIVTAMEAYDFSNATQKLYAFWQYDVCDVSPLAPLDPLSRPRNPAALAYLSARTESWPIP